ncbi:MAG: 50S ribosomal protein L11 methyltransferase [Deltaproteobacteria bacterium]|nr:50S ribosomal protein L11 methyltransferase [Deltaproteobacteria bacterium]MBW2193700.1 50S ribosomal protein L11 methyltransferase [Deltaproteobacteria bacterium]
MIVSEKTVKSVLPNICDIRKEVLETVLESTNRLTQGELEKKLSHKLPTNKKALSAAIKGLVADGELVYTYQFGCSFLERSFNKPVKISKHIVLKPHGTRYPSKPDEVVIELRHGAAFGYGEHPTTRLAIRGIEAVLSKDSFAEKAKNHRALDIGTGSGVLAIAAVALGAKAALGIDIDPCAVAEARENVKINRFEDRIEIDGRGIETIAETFTLILANLRYPTLKKLCGHITGLTEKGGAIVVSGIKTSEVNDLVDIYRERRFHCERKEIEKDWAGLVLVRHPNISCFKNFVFS